jgi:pimeloyl-ACP methyl ester carboxylesterase
MDDAGFGRAHIVGNSMGGYLAFLLAERDRAEAVVAFAPAGGWAVGDDSYREALAFFATMHEQVQAAAPHADAIASSPNGRRRATEFITTQYEHIPADLVAHQIVGAARCEGTLPLIDRALQDGWQVEPDRIRCPVRIVWGTEDRILEWPRAAARYRQDWFPHADWVELDGVGHCPQLDVPLEAAQLILGFTAR